MSEEDDKGKEQLEQSRVKFVYVSLQIQSTCCLSFSFTFCKTLLKREFSFIYVLRSFCIPIKDASHCWGKFGTVYSLEYLING